MKHFELLCLSQALLTSSVPAAPGGNACQHKLPMAVMFLVPMTPIRLTAPTATYQLCYFNILLLFFFFFFLRFLLVSFTFVLGFAIFFFLSHFLFLCCSFLLLIPLYFCFILSFQGAGLSIGGFVLFLFYFIWMLIFEGY